MKATSKSEPAKTFGFWARLGRAGVVLDMTPTDFLELRIERLENQVARLMGARERRSGSTSPTEDEFDGHVCLVSLDDGRGTEPRWRRR